MTSQQGQLQALITEIEALLGRAAPKLPWMGSGGVSEQRRVMGQALDYLKELQSTPGDAGWGLVASQGAAIAPTSATPETATGATAESQQVLQALLQEMQYLRAQMVQPLTSEVIALQQQRETLKNEVRQLEQERLQRAAAAQQPSPEWVNEVVTQLRSSLIADLTPKLQALPSAPPDELALLAFSPEQNRLAGTESLPQLSPQQRLEQLRQIQSQTDGMLLKLDGNLRAVFESLDQSIQSYCDTLNQGLGAMHGLGQQGEFIFRTFINHLAEQLQAEGSALAEQLASQQELARLQGDIDDSMDDGDDSAIDAQDDLMDAVVDFDDVELDDLSEFEGDDDFPLEEEVTLFQLDEEFEDWSDAEEDAAWSELASDREDQTIMQTEPIAWEVATGQADDDAEAETATDGEPTVAYTEEIDALYDNLFGVVAAPDAVAPDSTTPVAPSDAVEATVDEQLRLADTSAVDDSAPEAAIAEPATSDTEPPLSAANDTSLDLDFLLEAAEPVADTDMTATPPDEPPLEALLGSEMAAELSPGETAGTSLSDTITSLTELLPESEQQRQPDPFATFEETADTFIPASPDENLLDTEREVARPQVDLNLDDDTFGMLSTDLSRLEGSTPDETLAAAQLSESLELDDAPQDAIVPEFSELEPDALDASATAPTSESASAASHAAAADSFDFTALEMDETVSAAADQLEAAEEELFAELFDEASDEPAAPPAAPENAAPPSTDMQSDFEDGDEAWAGDRDSEVMTTAEDQLLLEADDSPTESAEESADFNLDADLELTALFGETDATDELDDRALTAELLPEAAEPSPDAEKPSDAAVVPPADSADVGDESTADDNPLLFELESASEAAENDGEDDILPRLDLDELELFDEPPLGSGSQSDRPQAPEASDSLLDFPDNPATDSDTPDAEASLEDFFNSDAPSSTASPAVTEPPATAESWSLDSFFDELAAPPAVDDISSGLGDDASQKDTGNSSDIADVSESPESAVTMSTLFEAAADSSDADLTLESAFDDAEAADDLAPDLTLEDAFGEAKEVSDRAPDFTLDDAFGDAEAPEVASPGFTLDDAFGDVEGSSDRDPGFTLDDAFGKAEEPEASSPGFTLEDAFGEAEEPEASSPGFTLEDAFGDVEDPEASSPGFTLEDAFGDVEDPEVASPGFTLEDAFGEADESVDDGPSLTLGDVFGDTGDRSDARKDDPGLTLESAFGEADEVAAAPDSAADFSLENAFGEVAPAAPAEATTDNATLDDFAAAVSSSPLEPSPAPNLIPDEPRTSSEPVPPITDPFLTVDDIGLDLGVVDANDDEISPELTLEADLFGGEDETATKPEGAAIAPDQLVDELELGDVPDDIAPIADDVSLETWGTALDDVPSGPPAGDDRLDFGSLGGDLAADSEFDVPATKPEEPETASVEDLFADSPDLGGPPLDEPSDRLPDAPVDDAASLGAKASTVAPELPTSAADRFAELSDPDSPSVPPGAEDTAPMLDSPPPETGAAATPEPTPSELAIATTADDGLQIVSDAPSEALRQALATLPELESATGQPLVPPDSPRPEPESTVSGSITDGYQLSFAAAPSDAAIDRALIDAPETTVAAFTDDADDAPDSSQLQREYGRRLTSWQGMVAATSLPFSTGADLSNLTIPDPDAPVSPARAAASGAPTSPAARPTESALSLTGSVEEGFAIVGPDAPSLAALLWPTLAADSDPETGPEAETIDLARSGSETGDGPEASAPLTDDELATLFPPEASAIDVASAADLDAPDLSEPSVADEGGLPADEPTAADLAAPSNDATREDALSAPESSRPELPMTEEPDDVAADRPPTAPDAATAEAGATNQDDRELSQTLESLDLSMEEIPEEDIATDAAFQFAFDDAMSAGDRSEADDEFLSAAAIADLDALTTDQEILPTARETAPAAPSIEPQEAEPTATPAPPAVPPTEDPVFASSGRLATLGDEPEATLPDDDDEPDEEWFLGIDLGTSGLSAVLMEHHSGSAHPLCWVPANASADTVATFRIPTVATLPTAALAGDAPFELLSVGPAAATPAATASDQRLLHTLRPLLRAGIPHHDSAGLAIPRVQWSDAETLPLQQVVSTVTALLELVSHPESAELQLTAIGLEPETLAGVLANLQGVVMGLPTHWSDTYCFNLREAVLAAGLVEAAGQVFFVEEAIAALLSGLPDPSEPAPTANRSAQALYQCHWQGGTVMIGSGAACTEVGIVDLPQPLDTVSREDFKLRNLAYGGDALDLDIICQLLLPSERRQTLNAGSRRSPNRGWGWQAALPEVANAKWADLQLDGIDLPRLAEPDAGLRQRLRQHLESSPLGQSLLEAARYLKLILQHQNQYQLELADQSWRVLRRDLESRVLVPYIQRINQQMNALLSQTGLASQGINQVICTGGNASFGTIAKWLRQKFPNATIIQDTYPSNRPQTCSRVAYGLVNLCRYPQILDVPRHQYSDYFLLHEMMRVIPDAPLPLDGILHLLEAQGLNVSACQSRIVAILEGHLPPGLLPDLATRELLSRDTRTNRTYQDLAAGSLFTQQTRNIYMVNAAQRDRLREHLTRLMQDKQQSLAEPLIAQLVAV
ncbi:hypothetical protein [Halomicronema sp. CCY15110]|uniref:hypothetical protein n=1 Tax=Halomicronema sp. CCY15110 TaxID=2767773 RepID=UPI001952544E|nr:hypothetical protein [Halomicronema sp. CCY15110]